VEKDMSVRDLYPDRDCPDCGYPIPKDAVDGSECINCGHVFHEEIPDEDQDPTDPDQAGR
jgi:rubredoxin